MFMKLRGGGFASRTSLGGTPKSLEIAVSGFGGGRGRCFGCVGVQGGLLLLLLLLEVAQLTI